MNLVERAEATEKTLTKFRGRGFDWKSGATCLHLARTQLVNFGYKPPKMPQFQSAIGAARALKQSGYADLANMFDTLGLARISPAAMWVGDIAVLPGDEGFDAILLSDGMTKLFGWHGDDASDLAVVTDVAGTIELAWRL
jgi:hypothetical protein